MKRTAPGRAGYICAEKPRMRPYKVPQNCIFRAVTASEYICLFCSFFYRFDKKRTFFLTAGSEKHILKNIELWLTKQKIMRTYNFPEEIILILKFEPLAANRG